MQKPAIISFSINKKVQICKKSEISSNIIDLLLSEFFIILEIEIYPMIEKLVILGIILLSYLGIINKNNIEQMGFTILLTNNKIKKLIKGFNKDV